MGEHPVNFVGVFADIFDEDDFPGPLELVRSAAHCTEEGEVSSGEGARGCSFGDGLEGVLIAFAGWIFEIVLGWGSKEEGFDVCVRVFGRGAGDDGAVVCD